MACKKPKLEELALLDLSKCDTISDIVAGMEKCSFGARCAGEVADTLHHIISKDRERVMVYDGDRKTTLGKQVVLFAKQNGFKLMTAQGYSNTIKRKPQNLVVVGRFGERVQNKIFEGGEYNTIFLNDHGLVTPGQIQDGHFPNVLFADPNYSIPLITATLDERLHDKRTTVTEFIDSLAKFDKTGKTISGGAKNFSRMANDPTYTVFMTMSGAMTVAQMSLVLCDMIDNSLVQSLTTTGAAMAHSLVESTGLHHYKHRPDIPDSVLAKMHLNRITDTYEPESNFDHIDEIMGAVLTDIILRRPKSRISPSEFHKEIGLYLQKHHPNDRGILKSAIEQKIPVFVPAFYDSELGNDITTFNLLQRKWHKRQIRFDIEKDNLYLVDMIQNAQRTGLFTVGGGVPRNWTQNVAPLIEIINGRTNRGLVEKMFSSGVRMDPAAMYLGHLSGCTYSEGATWRKMDPNGAFHEILADATIAWPIVVKYALENRR